MKERKRKPHVARRKTLKKWAARELGIPVNALGWIDGTLVFLTSNITVGGVPTVPKPWKPISPRLQEDENGWRPYGTSRP